MKLVNINSETLGEGLFALLRTMPHLLAPDLKYTPDILHHEAAAQSALLAILEDRPGAAADLPEPVRALISAFISRFMYNLTGPLANQTWTVPAGASPAAQARYAMAALLRQNSPPTAKPH